MPNVNCVHLMGNVTRDPELRYTPAGTAVCEVSLAINRKFEDREETCFVDITLWARTAEIASEYVRKGDPLYVQGRLQLDQWQDSQSGVNRSKLKVVGETIQLISSGQHKQNNAPSAPPQRPPGRRTAPPAGYSGGI